MQTRRQFLSQLSSATILTILPSLVWASAGTTLEKNIKDLLAAYHKNGRLEDDEVTAWLVTDIVRNQKIVGINETRPMQCASMVKPLVIQAYLYAHFLKSATLYPLNSRVLGEMRGMIVHSNNEFTNYIMKRLGGPQGVQWKLRKQAPSIFRQISVVEYIPKGGKTYLNTASAEDYARFLHALWHDRLPGADILKGLMKIKNRDRISVKTKYVPKNAVVYDKTGSTSRLCGNFGIIELPTTNGGYPYTFTGIIEKKKSAKQYSRWISDRSNVMRDISDVVCLDFRRKLTIKG